MATLPRRSVGQSFTGLARRQKPSGSSSRGGFFNLSLVEKAAGRPDSREPKSREGRRTRTACSILQPFAMVARCDLKLGKGWQSWAASMLVIRRPANPADRSSSGPTILPNRQPQLPTPSGSGGPETVGRCRSNAATSAAIRRRRNSSSWWAAGTPRPGPDRGCALGRPSLRQALDKPWNCDSAPAQ